MVTSAPDEVIARLTRLERHCRRLTWALCVVGYTAVALPFLLIMRGDDLGLTSSSRKVVVDDLQAKRITILHDRGPNVQLIPSPLQDVGLAVVYDPADPRGTDARRRAGESQTFLSPSRTGLVVPATNGNEVSYCVFEHMDATIRWNPVERSSSLRSLSLRNERLEIEVLQLTGRVQSLEERLLRR